MNMRRRLASTGALLALGFAAFTASADYQSTILSDSPSGYWRLGEFGVGQMPAITAGDIANNSGTGGAALNGYYLYDTAHPGAGALAGSADGAAAFDGFKNRVDVPYTPLLGSSAFSFELWVKLTNASTRALSPISFRDTNAQRGFVLYAFNGSTNWQFLTYSNNVSYSLVSSNGIQLDAWTHVAGTFNGSVMRLFINGAEAGAPVTNSSYTPNTAAPLRIGAGNNHTTVGDFFWPGSIDEAALYTSALDPARILAHYENGMNASRGTPYETLVLGDGPAGYWRFNEPAFAGSTSPKPIVNSGSLGTAANGVLLGITNSAVPIPGAENGVVGGMQGAPVGDANTALEFNGRDGRADVPYNPSLNQQKFTVEAWAKIPALYRDYQSVVASRNDTSVGGSIQGYIFYANNANTWQFWTANGSAAGWLNLTANNTIAPSVTNGQWTHLVGVYDGTNKFFYINGALVGFQGNITFQPNIVRPLRIGGGSSESPVGNYFVRGGVDEVAYYGQALSADRVLAHYTAGAGSAPAVTVAPSFTVNPPASTTVHSQQTQTFTAGGIGSLPMQLQWYFTTVDGSMTTPVAGATNNTLVISPTSVDNNGSYYLTASNAAGFASSGVAYLTVLPLQAPIADVPSVVPVYAGGTTRLIVTGEGTPPISYQWRLNGAPISGETNRTLVVTNAQPGMAANTYTVALSNSVGVSTSGDIHLQVLSAPDATYAQVMTNLQPFAYWRLGEDDGTNAFDYWNGNHGAYFESFPNQMPGALIDDDDGATAFYGANSRMIVSNSVAFNFSGTKSFTMTTWARPDVLSGVQRLFSNRSASGYGMGFRNNNQVRFTAFGVKDLDASVPAFNLGQWYHIAVVRNGTLVQIYIDGQLINSGDVANINSSTAPLQLSGNPTGTEWFTGQMDEAAVFDRPLTAAEVAALYGSRFGALVPPTITRGPEANVLYEGGTAHFAVETTGSQPMTYTWRANGTPIPGATNATLTIPNVTTALNGVNYSVIVANKANSATSGNASLTVKAGYGYQATVAADAPVAHWRFNDTSGPIVYDQRGGFNGVSYQPITFGKPGALLDDADAAYGFEGTVNDGVSSKVEVPHSLAFNPPVFSVEAWAKATVKDGSYRAVVSSRDYSYGYIIYASPTGQWQFWTRAPGVGWQNQAGGPVVEGEWTHLVGTFDGATKRFYINGELAASEANTNYSPNVIRNLRIGLGNNEDDPGAAGWYPFAGDIDEVAIYNYALPVDRIATHFQYGAYGTNTPVFLTKQPAPVTVVAGQRARLSVGAAGSPLLAYQWFKDGTAIPGANLSSFTLAAADFSDNGSYSVTVTNALGITNSQPVALTVMPPPLYANATNGLVLHMKFEGNYNDASGRGNAGYAVNTPAFVPGAVGQALHYNTDVPSGVYNYVTLGTPADLLFSSNVNFSVSYWTRFTGTPADLPFLSSAVNSYGNPGFTFAPAYNTGGWSWSLGDIANIDAAIYGAAASINDGQWHNLVHTFDRTGEGITYLDGVQVDSRPITSLGDIDTYGTVNIGQDATGIYPESAAGDLDELAVWRRVLSSYEAQGIYAAGVDGRGLDSYGPVALWVERVNTSLSLIWQAGTLESADSLSGPWAPVAGATSPFHTVPLGTGQKFYRVRL